MLSEKQGQKTDDQYFFPDSFIFLNLPKTHEKAMKLYTINTGYFKLDGGAMFGVVPKSIWNKLNPADDNNMCSWALRCLLVENGKQLILIDNGIGNKQNEKFLSYYYLFGEDTLDKSLAAHGFLRNDITDVFLTHLHFDHCGGSIQWNKDRTGYEPAFKNATYWSNEKHWKWATEPNDREKASFLKENILPIKESGQLKFCPPGADGELVSLFPDFSFLSVSGHTDNMLLPHINYNGRTLVYVADLIPSMGHIPLPYIMGYDTRPLITLAEKKVFLQKAVDEKFILFFEHDYLNECCTLHETERGPRQKEIFKLSEF